MFVFHSLVYTDLRQVFLKNVGFTNLGPYQNYLTIREGTFKPLPKLPVMRNVNLKPHTKTSKYFSGSPQNPYQNFLDARHFTSNPYQNYLAC